MNSLGRRKALRRSTIVIAQAHQDLCINLPETLSSRCFSVTGGHRNTDCVKKWSEREVQMAVS
jgi:hypothetical protein